jgi:hypothetical protein
MSHTPHEGKLAQHTALGGGPIPVVLATIPVTTRRRRRDIRRAKAHQMKTTVAQPIISKGNVWDK